MAYRVMQVEVDASAIRRALVEAPQLSGTLRVDFGSKL